jgi:hypothetical protein
VKPGTRIVSHAFTMGDWEPDAERSVKIKGSEYNAYFWVVPANMSGRWKIKSDQKGRGVPENVVVEQTFQKISVRAGDGGEVLGEGTVNGNEFTLTLNQSATGGPVSFSGTLDGDRVKATAASAKGGSWTAERESGSEKPIDPKSESVASS